MLSGILRYHPELRYTASGKALCSLVVGTEDSDAINCIAWEALGETIAEDYDGYRPGTRVYLTGYFKTREWTDRNGDPQSREEYTITSIGKDTSNG
jgi:single-stranded DNA-binding protein